PVRVALESFPDLGVLEDIDVRELGSDGPQGRYGLRGEAALREIGRTLHVQQHRKVRKLLLDTVVDVHGIILQSLGAARPSAPDPGCVRGAPRAITRSMAAERGCADGGSR